MTIAELHNKQGEEDSLTADVFGGFKYLSPAAGLLPFLAKAELFQKGAQLPSWNAEAALYCFWPRAKRREPDLFILLLRGNRSPVAIVVEAKYHSGKHNLHSSVGEEPLSDPSEAVKDSDVQAVARTDGDQLADYFCALLEGDLRLDQWRKYEVVSGSARFSRKPTQPDQLLKSVLVNDKYLLYVTAHYALPREDIDETLDSLSKRKVPKERNGQLLRSNWQNAASTFGELLKHQSPTLSQAQFDLALDTLSLLNVKGLIPYGGWKVLVLSQVPDPGPPYFWRPSNRFFVGISTSGLTLEDSPYFFERTKER
jgi:hypothetical protein